MKWISVCVLVVLSGLIFGVVTLRDRGGDPPMGVVRLDEHRTLGSPRTVGNLTVWPVFSDDAVDLGEIVTLTDALEGGQAEVRELGGASTWDCEIIEDIEECEEPEPQETASVGTLLIENKGARPLLVCAGTVVAGGHQDRQIAQDVIVAPFATISVDAVCVEQGRWSGSRQGVATGGRFAASGMAPRSVRIPAVQHKDQAAVWREVAVIRDDVLEANVYAQVVDDLTTHNGPDTSLVVAQACIVADSGEDIARMKRAVNDHLNSADRDTLVGFSYAINGRVMGVRTFADPALFQRTRTAFVETICREAFLACDDTVSTTAPDSSEVVRLVERIGEADEEIHETPALNDNVLRRSDAGFGAACVWSRQRIGASAPRAVTVTEDVTAK